MTRDWGQADLLMPVKVVWYKENLLFFFFFLLILKAFNIIKRYLLTQRTECIDGLVMNTLSNYD